MLSAEEIKNADYSTLVGLVRERNRPSGGVRTLAEFAMRSFLNPQKKVLEVGSNTGFSVVNIALLTGAHCTGIDINPTSISESNDYAKSMGAESLVEFKVGSALEIPFPDESFDALWVSNVTSFISNKQDAFKEYLRVLKPNGILGVAPIYYLHQPPQDLFAEVEKLVGAKINVRTREEWKNEILTSARQSGIHLVEYSCSNYAYDDRSSVIDDWLTDVLNKPELKKLNQDTKTALFDRYKAAMKTFNQNLQYCGFSLIMYQKRKTAEEAELFLTREIP